MRELIYKIVFSLEDVIVSGKKKRTSQQRRSPHKMRMIRSENLEMNKKIKLILRELTVKMMEMS